MTLGELLRQYEGHSVLFVPGGFLLIDVQSIIEICLT